MCKFLVSAGGSLPLQDGRLAAESTPFDQAAYDLDNDRPLTIGFGPHDFFNGCLGDVRLYNRALLADQVRAVAKIR